MTNHCPDAGSLIGETPLIHLCRMQKALRLSARLLAKAEMYNLTGSVKDRPALAMIYDGENRGLLRPGCTIVEPTSGNMGISLSAIAAMRGYRCMIVMPDNMSAERRALMEAYGAEVILTPGSLGMAGAVQEACRIAQSIPDSFLPDQFRNPANPAAHYHCTGPEIWAAAEGNVDILTAGVGTGGTITGTGRYLKEQCSTIHIIAAEPEDSPLLSRGFSGSHGIQGIGPNFIPEVLDRSLIDEVIPVSEPEARSMMRLLAQTEGIFAGISSGAALAAAVQLARQPENAGKTIAVILPDSGNRYLSLN